MKYIPICNGALNASEIILGCMRINSLSSDEVKTLIMTAIDAGVNFFDHSNIYSDGKCEELFGNVTQFTSPEREKVYIQTKCGIRKDIGGYDFSRDYIVECCDKSLKRLKTDYIDVFLLHRPDPLYEPEEVAEAFERLHSAGKVRYFGVSNIRPRQIDLLDKYLGKNRILVNQLQLSLMHAGMIESAVYTNTCYTEASDRDGELLDYCRLKGITVQAWSPIQYGFFEGIFLDNDEYPELNNALNRMAEEKNVSNSAIALAWILRHPAQMQVVIGTTKPERVKAMCKASGLELTRKEWWELYRAAGHRIL